MAGADGTSSKPAPPKFVELVARREESLSECVIELGMPSLEAANPVEGCFGFVLATLSWELWESAS